MGKEEPSPALRFVLEDCNVVGPWRDKGQALRKKHSLGG